MNFLLPVLMMTVAPPAEARYPQAEQIYVCGFEEASDRNFDQWPDGWSRKRGPGFPHFVRTEIRKQKSPVGEQSLRIDLNGAGAVALSPPVAIRSDSSYLLEGFVKTADLTHDEAFLSLTFLDEKQQPLDTFRTPRLADFKEWTRVHVGPVFSARPDAKYVVIGLHLEPTAAGEDLRGAAMFDDIWLARLPRIEVEANQRYHFYTGPDQVEIACRVAGLIEPRATIALEVEDAVGKVIDRADFSPTDQAAAPGEKTAAAGDVAAWSTNWKPRLKEPGFYRVRVNLGPERHVIHEHVVALAVFPSEPVAAGGEFGWSLPQGDKPVPLEPLAELLGQVGVNRVKFPLWFRRDDAARAEALLRFAERLDAQRVSLVGLLCDPPAEVREKLGFKRQPLAAEIFAADPQIWYPAIEPVLSRLSTKVRWWQLGDDGDASFVGYPQLAAKVAAVKAQFDRSGDDTQFGIGWGWLNEPPRGESPPWRFLALTSDPPLNRYELGTYLNDGKRKQTAERWVVVEPLDTRQYPLDVRVTDLVARIVAAKVHGADGIFVSNPFNTSRGLMNDNGTPGELLVPWRTTAWVLSGAQYVGSLRMPGGSQNYVFSRGSEAVMVAWSDQPRVETLYLGENVKQYDVWGRPRELVRKELGHTFRLANTPSFFIGLSDPVARMSLAITPSDNRVPSVFGKPHTLQFGVKNVLGRDVTGRVRVIPPEGWVVSPNLFELKLAAGEAATQNYELTLPFSAATGVQDLRFDFDLVGDRQYRFSAYRPIEVGLGDLFVQTTTRLNARGELEVEQRIVNHTDHPVPFTCQMFAPGRRRLSAQVTAPARGEDVKTNRYANGADLIGQTIWIRAEEINGQRVLNHRFVAER